MRRRLYSFLFVCWVALASVLPAQAVKAQSDFLDTASQDAGQSGIEHYIFWKAYYYAPYQNTSRAMKWWSPNPDNYMRSAVSNWNLAKPAGMDNTIETTGQVDADLIIYPNSQCPIANAAGCFTVSQWKYTSSWNVNVWEFATIVLDSDAIPLLATGAQLGIYGHEMGHAWGLGEQYTSSGTCNNSSYSVMDKTKLDSNNKVIPCDSSSPTSADIARLARYIADPDGGYGYRNVYFDTGQNAVQSAWDDQAYNDWYLEFYWYWSDVPGQPWHHFTTRQLFYGNGTHTAVEFRELLNYLNPKTEYGINGKYILICTRPYYNWATNWGKFQCGNQGYYFWRP